MKILTSFSEGKLTLFFTGELDHHGAKDAMKKVSSVIDEYMPRDCAIDLGGLTFMDSSGIAIILRAYKRVSEIGGRTWLENPPPQPLRVIDASGIDRMIRVKTNVKE
jgi:stage II sporulation protein AA (anti-sigma F factor antagonist)